MLLALLGYASVAFSLDPRKQIDQYVHDSWNSRHDFPGDAVYQILQTSDGYLWLRTAGGRLFLAVHGYTLSFPQFRATGSMGQVLVLEPPSPRR